MNKKAKSKAHKDRLKFDMLDEFYITASRSVHCYLVNKKKVIFIYNYEGTNYRLFRSLQEFVDFWLSDKEPKYSFESEEDGGEMDKVIAELVNKA